MSERPGQESDELTNFTVDDEGDLSPEDLDGTDQVDRGYLVPDRLHGVTAWGVTPGEEVQDETIDQRVKQERPDPDTAYGAPDNEGGLDDREEMVGGDDPDAIPAEQDYLGHEGGGRVGRLVAPDEGAGEDTEAESVAREDQDPAWDSPEESAMHYTDGDDAALSGDDPADANRRYTEED